MIATTTPRWMHAAAAIIILCGAWLRLFRLDEVPNFNADEGEYALMSMSLLRGEWPSNFIAPTGRPLVGPVLWLSHVLWALLTDAPGPGTIWWLRLPNAALAVLTLLLFWRWRQQLVGNNNGAALLGLALLSSLTAEVLGARMAWDPGAYGLLSLCLLKAAHHRNLPALAVLMVVSLCVHPLMACLLPVVMAHGADGSPLWQRGRQLVVALCIIAVAGAAIRGGVWLHRGSFSLAAVPGYWSSVLSGQQQWHEAWGHTDHDRTLGHGVGALLLLTMVGWRRGHRWPFLAGMLLAVAAAGTFVLNWRYGSMFAVPLVVEIAMAMEAHWQRNRVTVVGIPVFAGVAVAAQVTALFTVMTTAPQVNTMAADVQRIVAWSPQHVLADDWWAQRPLLLFTQGQPPFGLFRILPAARNAPTPEYNERTAFVMLADNPNIPDLLAEGRPSFPFMSSGRRYLAIGPIAAP
jgi:hypothetical protein